MAHPISRGCQKSMSYKFSIVADGNFPLWVKEKRGLDILKIFRQIHSVKWIRYFTVLIFVWRFEILLLIILIAVIF